jgi:hypothetical protein
MLQDQIKTIQASIRNYSKGLSNANMLVDIPWTMVDGDLNLQRLIFKRDNSLYIIKEGEIQESKWEYLPAMNSLVIQLGDRRILMNEVFVDEKALILKKDGTGIDFFAFANQNKLPDLNLIGYLKSLESNEIGTKPISQPIQSPSVSETFFTDSTEKTLFYIIISMIIIVVILTMNGFLK